MRATNKTFTSNVPVTIQAVSEEIVQIEESKTAKYVTVGLEYKDDKGDVVGRKSEYIISEDYQLLMSESPEFAPGKPANEYREQDLFYVIDLIRSRG